MKLLNKNFLPIILAVLCGVIMLPSCAESHVKLKTGIVEQHIPQNKMLQFEIRKSQNAVALFDDYVATISNDTISIFVPYLVNFSLTPSFTVDKKAKVYADSLLLQSGSRTIDFSKPVKLSVVAKGKSHTYVVKIFNSGLPVVVINTKNQQPIKSKKTWIDSTTIVVYKPNGDVDYHTGANFAKVKGRGNSTWSVLAKRPYAVKLKRKSELLGMPADKSWCLLANFFDASLLRNDLANYLGTNFTNLDWTPKGEAVELVLNGLHRGSYYLCEKVKSNKKRVPGNYLVEADRKAGKGDFVGAVTKNVFNVKDVAVKGKKKTDADVISHVKSVVDRFEKTLYGNNFLDASTGYKKLIDLESFVDWFLIKELSKDFDGNMFTSCFFHIMPDNTIKMGPIWDFDIAFGGNPFGNENGMGAMFAAFGQGDNAMKQYNDPEGYHIANGDWFVQMFKDTAFTNLLAKKVDYMVENLPNIMLFIDAESARLRLSVKADSACLAKNQMLVDPMDFDAELFEDMGFGGFPMPTDSAFASFGSFPMPMDSTFAGFGSFPMPTDSAFAGFGGFPMPDGNNFDGGQMPPLQAQRPYNEEIDALKLFVTKRLLWMQSDLKIR